MSDTTPNEASRAHLAPKALIALTGLAAVLMLVTLYLIFLVAPVEATMGVAQKIFYFHVPSAYAMYIGFATCAVGSGFYLAKRDERWDAVALAGGEVGTLFFFMVMTTGPLWARKAWGVYWTWDPRLTTTMLAGMVYCAYLVLRSFGSAGEVERRFAAVTAVFGLLILPFIHYSVQRWRGTRPTVITAKGGGLDPDMKLTLTVAFVTFTALVVVLIWARARVARSMQRLDGLRLDAAERGLLEEA